MNNYYRTTLKPRTQAGNGVIMAHEPFSSDPGRGFKPKMFHIAFF